MPLPQTCNAAGYSLVKSFECCELNAYQDEGGIWTIGYGHIGIEVYEGVTWTDDQADKQLAIDMKTRAEDAINSLVRVSLNTNQFSALCCFVFNIGSGNFKASTLLRLLNGGWTEQVPIQLARWNRVKGQVSAGLTRRRAAEIKLWNTPVATV